MKCPLCKKGILALCQDAIIPFSLIKKGNDVKVGKQKSKDINYFDNTWIECNRCGKTSDSDDTTNFHPTLEGIYDEL